MFNSDLLLLQLRLGTLQLLCALRQMILVPHFYTVLNYLQNIYTPYVLILKTL